MISQKLPSWFQGSGEQWGPDEIYPEWLENLLEMWGPQDS